MHVLRASRRAQGQPQGHHAARPPHALFWGAEGVDEVRRGHAKGRRQAARPDLVALQVGQGGGGARLSGALRRRQPAARLRLADRRQAGLLADAQGTRARPVPRARVGRGARAGRHAALLRQHWHARAGGVRHERKHGPRALRPQLHVQAGLGGHAHPRHRGAHRPRAWPRPARRGGGPPARPSRHAGLPARRGQDAPGDRRGGLSPHGRRRAR
mmetsp:Transcript_10998/g.45645  ORF Transcript_10998/g.45645 Transcript_10998/m.45645 type:complete len:214 (-) Transcript_10998:595-1236(-)